MEQEKPERQSARVRLLFIAAIIFVGIALVVAIVLLVPRGRGPVAQIEVMPTSEPWTDSNVVFDASASTPGVAPTRVKTQKYEWEFGDGGKASGRKVNYRYAAAGDFQVTLSYEVVDTGNRSHRAQATRMLTAEPSPLAKVIPILTSPVAEGVAGQKMTFDASGAQPVLSPSAPSLAYRWDYEWDFGDGSSLGRGAKVDHVFERPERYAVTVTVIVSDDLGRRGQAQATRTIDVKSPPRNVAVAAEPNGPFGQILAKEPVTFGAKTPSGVWGGEKLVYAWYFMADSAQPDRTTEEPRVVYPEGYPGPGTYLVKVEVYDEYGVKYQVPLSVVTLPIVVGGTQGAPFLLSGGLLSLGTLKLWNGAVGLPLGGSGFSALVGYATSTESIEIDQTAHFPDVGTGGGKVTTTIDKATMLNGTLFYTVSPPFGVGATVGVLLLEGEHSASCRCRIGNSEGPVPFTENKVILGIGVGVQVGFGLLSFQFLLSL